MNGMPDGGFTRTDINKVVMNYLVTEGYEEAAHNFQTEANVEINANPARLRERMQVREAIQSGDIEQAMQLVELQAPGLLASNDKIRFQVQLQHFVELVRRQKCEAALEFAQVHLAATVRVVSDSDAVDQLERAMALLAFDDPSVSPFSDLLLKSRRHKLASEVNAAILQSRDEAPHPQLASFYKLLLWVQDELDRRKVSYNKMVDVATATIEASN